MNKGDVICAVIIDDEDDIHEDNIILTEKPIKKKRITKASANILKKCYNEQEHVYEIGVDEVGRGPLFGRVYTSAVILPKDDSFDCSMVKDSKKFTSKKKILEAAEYIKQNALAWACTFEDEQTIDKINILQATQMCMHGSISKIIKQMDKKEIKEIKEIKETKNPEYEYSLLIDGNYFKPFTYLNNQTNKPISVPYTTIEGGDNKYASIAAASILAKVERDKYIEELCQDNPELINHYAIDSNKGYGAKKHIEGIKEHGITIWHRRSFGICKNYI
jgi:ribonuclease HII